MTNQPIADEFPPADEHIPQRMLATAYNDLRARAIGMERQWMPIETAPRDGTRIAVWPAWGPAEGTRAEVVSWKTGPRKGSRWELWCGQPVAATPTHWQPLPPPPTEQP